jgi:hypothetical protein
MEQQAGWRAWSGGWRTGEPPADWWLSTDGRWYPPGVQRPPGGPRWRGSAAEFRPREFALAGTTSGSLGAVGVVTRARSSVTPPDTPRHRAQRSGAVTGLTNLVSTTAVVLIAAVAAAIVALVFA